MLDSSGGFANKRLASKTKQGVDLKGGSQLKTGTRSQDGNAR